MGGCGQLIEPGPPWGSRSEVLVRLREPGERASSGGRDSVSGESHLTKPVVGESDDNENRDGQSGTSGGEWGGRRKPG